MPGGTPASDWVNDELRDDLEARPAGMAEPEFSVSDKVTVSREGELFVYHLDDDQLGQGSSLGNAHGWAETKGNTNLLNLFSSEANERVFGGMAISYVMPFSDLSPSGYPAADGTRTAPSRYSRAMAPSDGRIHLHPAYQQRQFVLGDGLHVVETVFVPRTGLDDACSAHVVVTLKNRTSRRREVSVLATVALRGWTPRDMVADYDADAGALLAWNESQADWVRVFGGSPAPDGHWATTDEAATYAPRGPLPNTTDETGELTGALKFDLELEPWEGRKVRIVLAFSPRGRDDALAAYRAMYRDEDLLEKTVAHYRSVLHTSKMEMSDRLLTEAVQWSKACILRPIMKYPLGVCSTNDPGHSSHLVGRDIAWFTHGCDWILPEASCEMLRIFADRRRDDGLIAEYIDGLTGESEDHDFNINDDTPLFLMAIAHHVQVTGHQHCLEELLPAARDVGRRILDTIDDRGLVVCTNTGMGAPAICSWRNVLHNETITGAVTEINSECFAALNALADLERLAGNEPESVGWRREAVKLKNAINTHLINPDNGLYVRNIDLEGRVFTQVTVDLVFPLICGVATPAMETAITNRLLGPGFMTPAGIRVLEEDNPNWDPSSQSGCLGGVWPGATWWFAMSCKRQAPSAMASALRRSYDHYVCDPKTYNTVPGQFSEWSDGQTLVNRGMRLSPWEAPRFLWVALEGVAGLGLTCEGLRLEPRLPGDWKWLRVSDLRYHDQRLSYFVARHADGLHVYTCDTYDTPHTVESYLEEVPEGIESLTVGFSGTVFRRGGETLLCLGSSQEAAATGAFTTREDLLPDGRYQVERLLSTSGEWQTLGVTDADHLRRITMQVEPGGYALFRLTQA